MNIPKLGRRSLFYLTTAFVIVALIVGSIALVFLSQAYHAHIDLTSEGLYSMTDAFKAELDSIADKEVNILFCAKPDVLLADETTRVVYYMAVSMSLAYDNIHVQTVDIARNPNAVQAYKSTSATEILWNYVIISTDNGYRVRSADSFWLMDEGGDKAWSYNGEYEMATVLLSLLAHDKPKVCVTYGHGEALPDVAKQMAFYEMIPDKLNAEVVWIDLDKQEIPSDCVLLVMNGMKEDYAANIKDYDGYIQGKDNPAAYFEYVSPIEKIERYLDTYGSLLVLKDPFVSLPVLEDFLSDWGITFQDVQVRQAAAGGDRLTAAYADSEEHALGHSLYNAIADLPTAPDVVLNDAGTVGSSWEPGSHALSSAYSVLYSPVLLAGEDTRTYNSDGLLTDNKGSYPLAAVVNRCYTDPYNGTNQYTYVFAAATTALVADEYIADQAYANGEVMFSALRTMTSTRTYSAMDFSINSDNYGHKILRSDDMFEKDTTMYLYGEYTAAGKTQSKECAAMTDALKHGYTVAILVIPAVTVAVIGIYFCTRRRHL